MARFNTIKIGSVWLTDDGLSGGKPCKTEVSGVDRLRPTRTGFTRTALSGQPYNFVMPNEGKGVVLVIRPYVLTESVFNQLQNGLDGSTQSGVAINVTLNGDTGDFDLECAPLLPQQMEFSGKFSNGRIFDVTINLVVVSINPGS